MRCIVCETEFEPHASCPSCQWDPNAVAQGNTFCQPGDILNAQYTIRKNLGTGRFGVSFRARDMRHNADVTIQFIHPAYLPNSKLKNRFINGMRGFMATRSEMLARIYDVGTMNNHTYVVTEKLHGASLYDMIENRKLTGRTFSMKETFPIFRALCQFLVESSAAPHGALCPRNIFIQPGHIKILDVGMTKNLPVEEVGYLMSEVQRNRRYVAPELIQGHKPGKRADVYSMGVMLGEMLTLARFNGRPGCFVEADPDIPEPIAEFVKDTLREDHTSRVKNAEEFINRFCGIMNMAVPKFQYATEFFEDSTVTDMPSREEYQAETTARVAMSDVIKQHYDEVTSVSRNPLLAANAYMDEDTDAAEEGSGVYPVSEVTQTISIDDIEVSDTPPTDYSAFSESAKPPMDDIDPRLLRAAAAPDTGKESSHEEISPRFLRAAAKLSSGGTETPTAPNPTAPQPTSGHRDSDWRMRISNETSKNAEVVSFVQHSVNDSAADYDRDDNKTQAPQISHQISRKPPAHPTIKKMPPPPKR